MHCWNLAFFKFIHRRHFNLLKWSQIKAECQIIYNICHLPNFLGGQFFSRNFGGILFLKRSCICSLSASLKLVDEITWKRWGGIIYTKKCFNRLKKIRFGWLCWGLTSQSTIFQSCRDGAIASWVINQYFRGVKCLAQGHNTAAVGLEPRTSRSGVRHSTTEPPRSPKKIRGSKFQIMFPQRE